MKGYRTIIFNVVLLAVLGLNQVFGFGIDEDNLRNIAGPLIEAPADAPTNWKAVVDMSLVIIGGVGNLLLRKITTTPIGKA